MRELLVIPQHTLKQCFFKAISQYNLAIHAMKKKNCLVLGMYRLRAHISCV